MDRLRMNHYWTKSVEECRRNFARGLADQRRHRDRPEEFLRRNAILNDVHDTGILLHLEALQAALERPAAVAA